MDTGLRTAVTSRNRVPIVADGTGGRATSGGQLMIRINRVPAVPDARPAGASIRIGEAHDGSVLLLLSLGSHRLRNVHPGHDPDAALGC
jgi:hypothetical protein